MTLIQSCPQRQWASLIKVFNIVKSSTMQNMQDNLFTIRDALRNRCCLR